MKLKDVLDQLEIPIGLTSLIAAPESVSRERPLEPALDVIEQTIAKLTKGQESCGSDAAWWGYRGQIAYYCTLRNILKAAELVGDDNLPDVEMPMKMSVLMDRIGDLETFGKKVLSEAERMVSDGAG